jgi:hypothetical protein
MGERFVSRTGRVMPYPTRTRWFEAEKQRERERVNELRLAAARNLFGHVKLRLCLQIRDAPADPNRFVGWLGKSITVQLREVWDLYCLWSDLMRFLRGWRPAHARPAWARAEAERLMGAWEKAGCGH